MASSERTNTIDSNGSDESTEKTVCRGGENNNISENDFIDPNNFDGNATTTDTNKQMMRNEIVQIVQSDIGPEYIHTASGSNNINNNNRNIAEDANGIPDNIEQSHVDKSMTNASITLLDSNVTRENGNHAMDAPTSENGYMKDKERKHTSGK